MRYAHVVVIDAPDERTAWATLQHMDDSTRDARVWIDSHKATDAGQLMFASGPMEIRNDPNLDSPEYGAELKGDSISLLTVGGDKYADLVACTEYD